jgi:hypothetical protein
MCILYLQGFVASGMVWVSIAWCVRIKGPLYASVFNPLFLVLVAIGGSLLLDEKLYLGRFKHLTDIIYIYITFSGLSTKQKFIGFFIYFWYAITILR